MMHWFEKSRRREFSTALGDKTCGEIAVRRRNTGAALSQHWRRAGGNPGIRLGVWLWDCRNRVRAESSRDASGEYFLYPAQVALLLPFPLGRKTSRPHLRYRAQIVSMGHANFWGAIKLLWNTTWHAVVVWALLAPFAVGFIYFVLLPIFRRIGNRQTPAPPAIEASAA
jgi:hypothetical protein